MTGVRQGRELAKVNGSKIRSRVFGSASVFLSLNPPAKLWRSGHQMTDRQLSPYSAPGTDRRSALPRQQSQVSEENRTRQSGTWEAAATAGCDPRGEVNFWHTLSLGGA